VHRLVLQPGEDGSSIITFSQFFNTVTYLLGRGKKKKQPLFKIDQASSLTFISLSLHFINIMSKAAVDENQFNFLTFRFNWEIAKAIQALQSAL
jgi:hypothetical protein